MMTDVVANVNAEQMPLIKSGTGSFAKGLNRLLLAVGFVHLLVTVSALLFWVVVVAASFNEWVVPATWYLLAGIWASPVAANFGLVAFKACRRREASDYEFVAFSLGASRVVAGAAGVALLCGTGAVAGAAMGREYAAAAMAFLHVVVCFSLALFALRVSAVAREESPANLYRGMKKRSWIRVGVRYAVIAFVIGVLVLFLGVNGSAAYRQFTRGWIFRHNKPQKDHYLQLPDGRMFYLRCDGVGAGPDSNVVVLMDADLASSSFGFAWLTTTLSHLWKTCVFDKPGYGWSTEGDPPRTVARETDDLLSALSVLGLLNSSRFVYVSHGLSSWNALIFQNLLQENVIAMVFIDPMDPRHQIDTNPLERRRLSFVDDFGYAGMLLNAFGFLRPFFSLMTYFAPAFSLPQDVLPLFIDSISRQSFWNTIYAENSAILDSKNETLSAFPFGTFALGDLPILVWSRSDSLSYEYFSQLSNNATLFNMTNSTASHFFLFEKANAADMVSEMSQVVGESLRGGMFE